jgi:hypothetical protein
MGHDMRSILLLALGTTLSLAASAAEFEDHLRVDLSVGAASQPREGILGAAQIGFAWEIRPGLSVEFWQARAQTNEHAPPTEFGPFGFGPSDIHIDIDQMSGLGLRYDFDARPDSSWHPFLRAGLAKVRGSYSVPTYVTYGDDTLLVGARDEYPFHEDARYVALGGDYALNQNWSASAQLQYVSTSFSDNLASDRTELLLGIGYRY